MVSDDAMAWEKRMGQQKERRKDTDDLWSRLDDLVTNESDFPSPPQPCALSTRPRTRPFELCPHPRRGHCAQICLAALTGEVSGRRSCD